MTKKSRVRAKNIEKTDSFFSVFWLKEDATSPRTVLHPKPQSYPSLEGCIRRIMDDFEHALSTKVVWRIEDPLVGSTAAARF